MVQDSGGELPQIEKGYLDQNTSLVTISIGGNDARFGDVIQKCMLALGNCASKTFESGDTDSHVGGRDTKYVGKPLAEAIPGVINTIVRRDITETLKQINAKAPNAKTVLMGYPPLFSDKANCLRLEPGISIGLSEASTEWLNGIAGTLAEAMEGASAETRKPPTA
ncbi:hypothetical protein ABZY14_29050 [Streptomyces sp. NPDC006617]|uniref:hypothetical protein n=1 Tax=Streptomyces sp. NPDC006617 TaxID=3155354 RepID=UPI0033A007D0